MRHKVLVSEYRNKVLENIHSGHIVGVNEKGRITYTAGDPEHVTYLRSSAKPIQAIPAIMHNIDEAFGLTRRETSLIMASHRGEPFHIKEIEKLLEKVGVAEEQLLCLPAYPLNPEASRELYKNDQPKRRLYHNCSGKHLGMIALAKVLGVDIDGYWEKEHPVQQEILKAFSAISGSSIENIVSGVDGCGVPVYGLPLKKLATMYLRFASPDLIEDESIRNAAAKIAGLMSENPDIISGSEAICTCLLMDENIVAKGGAQGVYCFGLKKERLGFALKVMDGSETEWPLIVAGILEQIGYQNQETMDRLHGLLNTKISNDNDKIVGTREISFQLQEA